MGCWGDGRIVFGWNVPSATPPASAAEVAAAVAAAAANADGLDNQEEDIMMMHLYGEGNVSYYCESSLRENCESEGGSQYTNNWGRQLHLKFLSVCCEIEVHNLC